MGERIFEKLIFVRDMIWWKKGVRYNQLYLTHSIIINFHEWIIWTSWSIYLLSWELSASSEVKCSLLESLSIYYCSNEAPTKLSQDHERPWKIQNLFDCGWPQVSINLNYKDNDNLLLQYRLIRCEYKANTFVRVLRNYVYGYYTLLLPWLVV